MKQSLILDLSEVLYCLRNLDSTDVLQIIDYDALLSIINSNLLNNVAPNEIAHQLAFGDALFENNTHDQETKAALNDLFLYIVNSIRAKLSDLSRVHGVIRPQHIRRYNNDNSIVLSGDTRH